MPCRRGLSLDEFREQSYMVHSLWGYVPVEYSLPGGVLVYTSTPRASMLFNDHVEYHWHFYDVYHVAEIIPEMLLGYAGPGRYLGPLIEFEPRIRMLSGPDEYYGELQSIRYQVAAGFSGWEYTADGDYHAIDIYYQPPSMYGGRQWMWYVGLDIYEPEHWYKARQLQLHSTRELSFTHWGLSL